MSALTVSSVNLQTSLPVNAVSPVTPGKAKPFTEVLSEVRLEGIMGGAFSKNGFGELQQLQQKILKTQNPTARDLLLYQVRAAQFGMGVELVSKIAESVSATIRKFQSNQ